MKKDVLIEIKGVYKQEGDEDEIELFTTGSYYKRNGNYYIAYDESEATGFDGTHTVLKVEQSDKVTLLRTGTAKSQLIVERGVRHQCHYDTGYGPMMIGVSGDRRRLRARRPRRQARIRLLARRQHPACQRKRRLYQRARTGVAKGPFRP